MIINKFIESDITQKQIFQYCILSIPSFISISEIRKELERFGDKFYGEKNTK